jgi:hypothetical protein
MLARYILGGLAIGFGVAALIRMSCGGGKAQARTWLIIAAVFGAVSAWLFLA